MTQELSKGNIYKNTNDLNNDIYVGSTCNTLAGRLNCHNCKINREQDGHLPLYTSMKKIGTNRFRIELIEEYPCEDKY